MTSLLHRAEGGRPLPGRWLLLALAAIAAFAAAFFVSRGREDPARSSADTPVRKLPTPDPVRIRGLSRDTPAGGLTVRGGGSSSSGSSRKRRRERERASDDSPPTASPGFSAGGGGGGGGGGNTVTPDPDPVPDPNTGSPGGSGSTGG